ncbi:MAG: M28 family peptidase [bacterium]
MSEGASDGAHLLHDLETFAFPRAAGGPEERRAAELVRERFESLGLPTEVETFRVGADGVRRLRLRAYGLVAAAIAIVALFPGHLASGLAGVVALLAVPFLSRWNRGIERFFDTGPPIESRNVIARRPGSGEGAPKVVFLAHVDSKSAALPTFVTVVVILAALAALIAGSVSSLAAALGRPGWIGPAGSIPAAVLLAPAVALVAMAFVPTGDRSPGAMDNATGVAVLLELARTAPHDPGLDGAELVFLATGAEEVGLCGAMRWIQRHEAELDRTRTIVINVDSVGVGRSIVLVDARGRIAGRGIGDVLAGPARECDLPVRWLRFLPGVGVDSMPFGARGFATVSVLGGVLGGASRRIHTPSDEVRWIRGPALASATRLANAIAREAARVAG